MLLPLQSVFTGQMPFLPPNQQLQSTEGMWTIVNCGNILKILNNAEKGRK